MDTLKVFSICVFNDIRQQSNNVRCSYTNLETNTIDKILVGVSITTLDNKTITLGTSSSSLETNKADKLQFSTSASKFLQRNEFVLPSTFTQFNTSDNILINSDGANRTVGQNLEFRTTNDDIIFRAQGGLVENFRITQAGSANFTDNLSVSGVLQNPLTSLLSVSSSNLEKNKMNKTLVGVSVNNLINTIGGLGIIVIGSSIASLETNKMDRGLIGSSCANYQSRNDLMISYTTLNGNGIGGYNSFDPNICPLVLSKNNRPFYFNRRISADDNYNCLDFMSWNNGNPYMHVATFGFNGNCMGLGTTTPGAMFHATGSAIVGTNLTVSGVLQSPLTNLLCVSMNNCVKTDNSASLNKLTVLGSITANTLYLDDYFGIANKSDNQKFAFGGGINYYRSASHQFNNQANIVTYLDLDNARELVPGNLTVSGVVQSPLTSLISVSCGNYIQNSNTSLPSSFTSSGLTNFTSNIYVNNTKVIIGTTGTPLSYVKQLINSTDGTAQTEYRGTGAATGVLTMGLAHSYGDAYIQLQYANINQPLNIQNYPAVI